MTLKETVGLLTIRMDNPIRQLYADLQSIRGTYNQLAEELNNFSSELDHTVPTVSLFAFFIIYSLHTAIVVTILKIWFLV